MSITAIAACSGRPIGGFSLVRLALLALTLGACQPASEAAATAASEQPRDAGFDFYVLSLSWSPGYCEAEGEDANRRQCSRPLGFVVHGLWPQFERGYPENCPTSDPDIPSEAMSELTRLIPSAGLVRHQWRKHGSCSGLSRRDYFDAVGAAWTRVRIPPGLQRVAERRSAAPVAIEAEFLAANPGMTAAGIAVTCGDGLLREVRICMTKALEFRSCPEVDARGCRASSVTIPPVE
jgi:ribonuclease T2